MSPPRMGALETSSSVAALRETLCIAQAEHAAEQREAARRMSQQAQRYATTEEGLNAEKVQIEADVRVRRMLNALRQKDEALSAATKRVDELEELKRHALGEAERLRARCAELEANVRQSTDHATHMDAISRATKTECSRLKGQLANANFDLDLATQKYERLLATQSTVDLANDLVGVHLADAARRAAGEDVPDDALGVHGVLEHAGHQRRYQSFGTPSDSRTATPASTTAGHTPCTTAPSTRPPSRVDRAGAAPRPAPGRDDGSTATGDDATYDANGPTPRTESSDD